MKNALVVNDDEIICDRIAQILESTGWEVYTAEDKLGARRVCETFLPVLVVIDVEMQSGVGFEAISQVRRVGHDPYIIAVTRGAYDYKIQRVAEVCGADKVLVGPVSAEKLHAMIQDGRAADLLNRLT